MALGGKMLGSATKSKVRGTGGMKGAVTARKSASMAAAAAPGAGATQTTTSKAGFGVLGNPRKAGIGTTTVGKGTRGVGGALRSGADGMKSGSGRKKPSGMY